MSAGDLALVVATVLCILGFTALVVALVFVFRSLTELRGAVDQLTAETQPLLRRDATDGRRRLGATSTGSTRCSGPPRRFRLRSRERRG